MNLIIAGSRTFSDYLLLEKIMNKLTVHIDDIVGFSGTQKGTDQLGERWYDENRFMYHRFYPDWDQYGKRAGPIRNQEMVKAAGPKSRCVVFYDGSSPGSTNMIETARAYGLKLKVILYKEQKYRELSISLLNGKGYT